MEEICDICEGSGLRISQENGRQVARTCECRLARRAQRLLAQARIPTRFNDCSIDGYETALRTTDPSLKNARLKVQHFLEGYPFETSGKGLLLIGSSGLGKTHLAVALLKHLILERGATGIFWEHKELMEAIRATYESNVLGEERNILRTVTQTDVLVLDDLGDMNPTEWSSDTTSYILNARYNANLSTIITTNRANAPELPGSRGPSDRWEVKRAATTRTLGDQIGERMRSRLQEMCVVVEMQGEDFRQKVKRASFA